MRRLIAKSRIERFDAMPMHCPPRWDAIDGLLYGTGLGCALSLAGIVWLWIGGALQ